MTTLPLLNEVLSPALVRGVGYALLHSLWQGGVLAGLLAGVLPLLRRHRAEVRYTVAASALGVLVLAVALTFSIYYSSPAPVAHVLAGPAGAGAAWGAGGASATAMAEVAAQPAPLAWLRGSGSRFEAYLPVLVAAWLLGLLLMSGRLAGGLFYTRQLRRAGTQALGAEWQRRLAALAQRAGVRRPVALLESARVAGPLVLGHLRPVILLPLGAVAGLPPALLEALLAHELAHIVRRDYLLNLGLAVAEALFFYHPAVWFMANCLRAERENCCDDQAAALCGGDRLRVARALAALAELEAAGAPASPLALAAAGTGGRGSLLARVRRLALGRPQAPSLGEGLLATLLGLVGVAGLSTGVALAAPVASKAPKALLTTIKQTIAPADTARKTKTVTGTATTTSVTDSSDRKQVEATAVATSDANLEMAGDPRDRLIRRFPRQGRPSTVVIEKDKKGRVVNLTVDGQPIETATSKKVKRGKKDKVRTVEVVTVPATPRPIVRTLDGPLPIEPLQRLQRRDNIDMRGFNFNFRMDGVNDEARRAARRGLAEALRNPDLTDEQRREMEKAMSSLGAVGSTGSIGSMGSLGSMGSTGSLGSSEVYKQFGDRMRTFQFRLQDSQLQMRDGQRRLRDGQRQLQRAQRQFRMNIENNGMTNLNGLAERSEDDREAAREAAQAAREAAHEAAQAAREAEQDGREAEQAGREAEQASRAASRANVAARRAALQARIASAQAELRALNNENATARGRVAFPPPRLPRVPQAPMAPPAPPAAQGPTMPQLPPPPPPAPNTNRLREELRRDGLINDEKHFSFELNDEGGRANGKTLTPAQVAKYRKLFNQPAPSGKGKTKSNFNISIDEN